MLVSNNTSDESANEETFYDSEKDPEYVLTPLVKENCDKLILSSPLLEVNTPSTGIDKSVSYVQSPIGKIMVENIDDNLEKNLSGRPMSNEPIMSNAVYDTTLVSSYIQSPIGKVRVENIKSISEPQ